LNNQLNNQLDRGESEGVMDTHLLTFLMRPETGAGLPPGASPKAAPTPGGRIRKEAGRSAEAVGKCHPDPCTNVDCFVL
jgi:hypothetical protein